MERHSYYYGFYNVYATSAKLKRKPRFMGGHVWTKREDFGARKRRNAAFQPPRFYISSRNEVGLIVVAQRHWYRVFMLPHYAAIKRGKFQRGSTFVETTYSTIPFYHPSVCPLQLLTRIDSIVQRFVLLVHYFALDRDNVRSIITACRNNYRSILLLW